MIHRRRSTKLLASLFAFSLLAAACGDDGGDDASGTVSEDTTTSEAASGEVSDAGTITFAGDQEPTSLNWLHAEDNAAWTPYFMMHVWPFLYVSDPANELIPNEDLATAEVTSEDPQVLTITINPDATWSDGTPITAADFIFTWEAQRDCLPEAGWNCAFDNGYKDIESVVAGTSDKEVVATFATPYADWQSLWRPVFPAHAFAAAGGGDPKVGFTTGYKLENLTGANAANLEELVVSGGPYLVTAIDPGGSLTLTRNPDYWGEPAVTETIVIPWITDATQQPAAFANGEADGGFPQVQIDLLQQLQGLDGFTTEVGFGTFWENLDLNSANPHLALLEIRQAFALALDREGIVDTLLRPFDESAEVLNNRIFFPADDRYVDNSDDFAGQDLDGARELIESAGYTEGDDGVYVSPDGERLELRISWPDPNPRRQQIAELIQAQVAEAGISMRLAPQPDFSFLDNRDFDVAVFGWSGGTALAQTESIYVADGAQNYTGLGDPRIAQLYDQANVELDGDARAELMNQIDELIWEQMSTIPLAQNPDVLVSADRLGNFVYNGFVGPMWNMPTWGAR